MSLFGSIGNLVKKAAKGIAKVVDNPVTRVASGVLPGGAAVSTLAAGIAGNKRAVAQFMGTPGFVAGGTPQLPGFGAGFSFDPRPTTTSGGAIDALTPDWLVRPQGVACQPKQLKSGKVRYPRMRADGTCYFPRRMNPLNPRAARRAIRRIKAVRRITRDIERSLPKQTTRRRAA